MAVSKKAAHVVIHPKLRLRVDGKNQRMPVGHPITMDGKVADRLVEKGFIKKIGNKSAIEVGGNPTAEQVAEAKKIVGLAKKAEAEAKKLADAEAKKAEAEAKKLADANK